MVSLICIALAFVVESQSCLGEEGFQFVGLDITNQSGCHCFLWFAYFCRSSFLFILWLKVNDILYLPNTPYVAKKNGCKHTTEAITEYDEYLNHSENSKLVSLRDFWFYKVGDIHYST